MNNVKKENFKNSLFTALLLASPLAGADAQYPAADYKPEVVYQDAEYIGSHASTGSSASSDSNYPAANYQPEVLYQDSE
ncbi:MAG: hypothetical protein ACU833_01805, partial [Gammaproteobacteria bacterium]